MSLDILKNVGLLGGGAIVVILSLIQIAPIKINPWTAIARCIGRAINGEVLEKVDGFEEEWAELRRTHILRFGDEIRLGVDHSEEHFDQVLYDISKYEKYCKSHPAYVNNKAEATIHLIKQTYEDCLSKNKFL